MSVLLLCLLAILLQAGPIYLPIISIASQPTATPTTSSTPTATPTATWTPTATPTATWTPTTTWTPSATPTTTWTPTATPTATVAPGQGIRIGVLSCRSDPEYIRIDNSGPAPVSLASWRIHSVIGDQWYIFPGYTLQPGDSVYVQSGSNAPPTSGNRLRWTTNNIWNNNGDQARLLTPGVVLVDSRTC